MSRYDTAEELGTKLNWEGGVMEFIFGYGLSVSDLPADLPDEVREAFVTLATNPSINPAIHTIEAWAEEFEV